MRSTPHVSNSVKLCSSPARQRPDYSSHACPPKPPDPPTLAFFDFLVFFLFRLSLLVLSVFPFFSKDLRGSAKRKTLCFFRGVSLAYFKIARVGGSGPGGGSGSGFPFFSLPVSPLLGSGRGTVGKCTGPKWSKMVQTTILVKMTLFRTGF